MRRAAYRAGISDVAFWNMTPEATVAAISELERADLSRSWLNAFLQRCDPKHFPNKPSDLWTRTKSSEPALDVDALVAFGKARRLAKEQEKIRKAAERRRTRKR